MPRLLGGLQSYNIGATATSSGPRRFVVDVLGGGGLCSCFSCMKNIAFSRVHSSGARVVRGTLGGLNSSGGSTIVINSEGFSVSNTGKTNVPYVTILCNFNDLRRFHRRGTSCVISAPTRVRGLVVSRWGRGVSISTHPLQLRQNTPLCSLL